MMLEASLWGELDKIQREKIQADTDKEWAEIIRTIRAKLISTATVGNRYLHVEVAFEINGTKLAQMVSDMAGFTAELQTLAQRNAYRVDIRF